MVVYKVDFDSKNVKDSINSTKAWQNLIEKFNKDGDYQNIWLPDFIDVDVWGVEASVCHVRGCTELFRKPEKVIERLKQFADAFDASINDDSSVFIPSDIDYIQYRDDDKEYTTNSFKSTPTAIFKVHSLGNMPVGVAFDVVDQVRQMYDGIDFSKPTQLWVPKELLDVEFIETNTSFTENVEPKTTKISISE